MHTTQSGIALAPTSPIQTIHGHLPMDAKAFRNALGKFPTGVAIVTTRTSDGRPVGLTINSFASLSLDPPLVLWSLVNRSPSLARFVESEHFSINVLAASQAELALSFANSTIQDKFSNAETYDSPEGIPLIADALASFVCCNEQRHAGGDHTLFVGRVVRYFCQDGEPAVFHKGQFTALQS